MTQKSGRNGWMNRLAELIEAVEVLAESKTDLAQAYQDLLEEINSEVGKFSRMDEKDISSLPIVDEQ